MYEDVFEKKFLQATENRYAAEGQQYMQDNDVSFTFCLLLLPMTSISSYIVPCCYLLEGLFAKQGKRKRNEKVEE